MRKNTDLNQVKVRWISDERLQEETVGSTPPEVTDSLMCHKMDGELSVCTLDGTEVLIAKDSHVLMARDVEYRKQLNELLCQAVCESAAHSQDDHTDDMGSGGM